MAALFATFLTVHEMRIKCGCIREESRRHTNRQNKQIALDHLRHSYCKWYSSYNLSYYLIGTAGPVMQDPKTWAIATSVPQHLVEEKVNMYIKMKKHNSSRKWIQSWVGAINFNSLSSYSKLKSSKYYMYLIYFLRDSFCHIGSILCILMYLYISNEFSLNVLLHPK